MGIYNRNHTIQKAVAEIKNIFPKDDLITNYQDFLRQRDFLSDYKYNPKVFIALIDLTYKLWKTDKRISRTSLIKVSNRYYSLNIGNTELPSETNSQLFELFKELVYFKSIKVNDAALLDLQRSINRLLMGIKLSEVQLKWLLENTDESAFILNRVLRYKWKSTIISAWARENYYNNHLRHRRAEIAGWVIDEQDDFIVSKNDLLDDLNHFIVADCPKIMELRERQDVYEIFNEFVPDAWSEEQNNIEEEQSTIRRKYYGLNATSEYFYDCSGIDRLKKEYNESIDQFLNTTNVLAIGYSRHNKVLKSKLLKRNYSIENEWRFFSVCKKYQLVGLMRWLLNKKNVPEITKTYDD